MTLDEILPGEECELLAVGGEGVLRRRLLDMGFTPHTKIKMRKIAPMGDPLEVSLRGYVLTIRKEEAAKLTVQKVSAQ